MYSTYKISDRTDENADALYDIIVDKDMSGTEVFNMFVDWHGTTLVTREMCENLRDCEGFNEFEEDDGFEEDNE